MLCVISHILQKFYRRRPQGLQHALSQLGLQFEGREHSGLCDARNTALLAWRMVQDGAILKVTKDIQRKRRASRRAPFKVDM
jgi:Inhibitor of the KinA pathway to sporulation, predicted exonuclease